MRVPPGGSVVYQLSTVHYLRITRSISVGAVYFRRSYQGVRNKESRFIHFAFVKGGTLVFRFGARERAIPNGAFTVLKDNTSYSTIYQPDSDTMEVLVVAIPKHELAPLVDTNLDFENAVETDQKVFDLLHGLSFLLFQSADMLPDDQTRQMTEILVQNAAQWIAKPTNQGRKLGSFVRRYQEIDAYIRNNISDRTLGADIIAKELHISPRYLGIILAKNGLNLREVINRHRIEKAKALLGTVDANSDTSIKEIGAMVGYRNAAHFSFIFRKYMGVSPVQYLRHLGEG